MLALSVKIHEERDCDGLSHFKWIVEESREHWILNKHCFDLLLPKFFLTPDLSTDETKFYWNMYYSRGKCEKLYRKNLSYSLDSTLSKGLQKNGVALKSIWLSENLINFERFDDALSRKNFVCKAANLIRNQSQLEIACFEGLRLTKVEGYELLSALSTSHETLKFLFIWQLFKCKEYTQPEKTHLFSSDCDETKSHHVSFHCHWLDAIEKLHCLETLCLNYAYISSSTGDLLIHVARQLGRKWRYLQLLCLEEEIPDSTNAKGEKIVSAIPDFAWNVAREYSPKLRVQIVLFGITEYDKHKKFITSSIPMHTVVLSTNRELLFHKPCMLDCTFKTLYLWYHRHLVQLYINLWNHREAFDHHLRKIFPCLPNLKEFEFVGGMKDPVTICTMCCQIKIGTCAVKTVRMQLQMHGNKDKHNWLSKINESLKCFAHDFEKLGVSFEIYSYPA